MKMRVHACNNHLSGIVDGDDTLNDWSTRPDVNVLHNEVFNAMKDVRLKTVISQARSRARYEKLAIFHH